MGECDVKFAHVSNFDGSNQDFDLDIRTTIQDNWSYIGSAALKIGDDILEVSSYGEYSFNGVASALVDEGAVSPTLGGRSSPLAHIGGYPIHHRWVDKKHFKHVIDVVLDPTVNVTITNVKQLVGVSINHASEKHFGTVEGLMGNFNGELLARNGVLDMKYDVNSFAQEW